MDFQLLSNKGRLHKGRTRFLQPTSVKNSVRRISTKREIQEIEARRRQHLSNDKMCLEDALHLKRGLVLFTTKNPPRQKQCYDDREVTVARSSGAEEDPVSALARFREPCSPVRNSANEFLTHLHVRSDSRMAYLRSRDAYEMRRRSPEFGVGVNFEVPSYLGGALPSSNFHTLSPQAPRLHVSFLARQSARSPNYKVNAEIQRKFNETETAQSGDHQLAKYGAQRSKKRENGNNESKYANIRSIGAVSNRRHHMSDCTGVNAGASSLRFTQGRHLS